jgi:two-component sensor histidine kinase
VIAQLARSASLFRGVEMNIRCKDGSEKIISWSGLSEQFPVLGWKSWVVGTDISGLREIERDLNDLLEEKDRLLKEVYHRVKNNIAMIISLVSLQQTLNEDDAKLEGIFNNLQNKLKAIGLVHEHLYSSDSVSRINVKTYLEELIDNIEESAGIDNSRVLIRHDIDYFLLDADFVISIGMIVAELLTNAGKYAFPEGRSGCIHLVFKAEDEDFNLSVSDDGVGIAEPEAPAKPKSLGLSIVRAGVRRYGGTVDISGKRGTQVEIRIPKKEAQHKN